MANNKIIDSTDLLSYFTKSETNLVIENTSVTTAQTTTSLNTLYPTATARTMVLCVGISPAVFYIKKSVGGWISFPSGTTV